MIIAVTSDCVHKEENKMYFFYVCLGGWSMVRNDKKNLSFLEVSVFFKAPLTVTSCHCIGIGFVLDL